jgi:hypothetical protein
VHAGRAQERDGRATLTIEYRVPKLRNPERALSSETEGAHLAVGEHWFAASRIKRIPPLIAISSYHCSEADDGTAECDLGNSEFGGSMAINFVRTRDGSDDSIRFQLMERLKVYLFGATVLFASFGMGEAVYRLLFSEFDGITDRIPVEVLFGLVFAWVATKFVGGVYRNRKERSARLNFIWARNHQIRGALEGITPLAHPSKNQQSIRVIREEVERIEWALKEILPG